MDVPSNFFAGTRAAACSLLAAASLAILPSSALSAATPEQKCEVGKLSAAGKYSACAAKAAGILVLGNTPNDFLKHAAAMGKCESKLMASWEKLENAAVAAGTTCPSTGDSPDVVEFSGFCVAGVGDEVAGGDLPPLAQVLETGQTRCYLPTGGNLDCAGTGQDGQLKPGREREFRSNGDGTVTDLGTGLQWEVLTFDLSIHDVDNTYSFTDAVAVKISTLNANTFAGHPDWRLPTRFELETLVNLGDYSPATYSIFEPIRSDAYWTATSHHFDPTDAWAVHFAGGGVGPYDKATTLRVRAVRGGS